MTFKTQQHHFTQDAHKFVNLGHDKNSTLNSILPTMTYRTPLSLKHPLLYWLRIQQRQIFRALAWQTKRWKLASIKQPENLDYRVFKHSSKLIRRLGNSDIALQHGKIQNLNIAIPCIDGILIQPGETFSFCYLVGRPSKTRGFVNGMELSFGKARPGIGGGICQLANLIHWMALHSPLAITERSNHSFDPFPDDGRVLPFGVGAAIFYNFVDLMIYNPTAHTFQLRCWLTDTTLEGDLRSATALNHKYHIYEKNHRFTQINNQAYRENEIWRQIITKGHQPTIVEDHLCYKNQVRVMYPISFPTIQEND
jgi:vancomycin resistance protein VanW